MRFEFATAARIIFGPGTLAELAPQAQAMGQRALVIGGAGGRHVPSVLDALAARGMHTATLTVSGEPDLELIRRGTRLAADAPCDLVVGVGGGSVIDAAKAIAALAANGGDPLDYLEVIGRGRPLTVPSLPCIAVPTTAGTGAEVTRNAVLASPEHGVKASLRSPFLLPRLAVVDPLLTHSMPPAVTASTGLDALTQLIEPYVSLRAQPLSDGFCREGMMRVARSLRKAWRNGDDADAREDMALASLLGGLALANAGLGAVHGIASVVGGMFPAPHGGVCARLLPIVMGANLRALQARQPQSPALARYNDIARLLTGHQGAFAADGVGWLHDLCSELGIPALARYGMRPADVAAVAQKSLAASSTKANPIALTADEMAQIIAAAL